MLGNIANPIETRRFENWVNGKASSARSRRRKAMRDGVGDKGSTLFLQALDKLSLLCRQSVESLGSKAFAIARCSALAGSGTGIARTSLEFVAG